jgi:hypothetical protein
MKAYKLVRLGKDGNCYPLFINKKQPFTFGKEMIAEYHPTPGFAGRMGFHCCFFPYAPHLKEELKSGEKRAWIELEVSDYSTYDRPESQGGAWILANKVVPLRVIPMEEAHKLAAERQ